MGDGPQAPVRSVHHPERVVDRPAGCQHAARVLQRGQRRAANLPGVEVPIPPRQILDRREQARRTDRVEVRNALPPDVVGAARVRIGPVLHHHLVIVVEVRGPHAERLEDTLPRELPQRLPRDPLDDDAEQRVAGIAVEMLRAGIEVERRLARRDAEDVGRRHHVRFPAPARHRQQVPLIAQAARVVRQVPERDGLAEVRHLRDVLPHVVVERQPAVRLEQRDGRRRELLRH